MAKKQSGSRLETVLDDIVKYFESFVGNLDDKKLRKYVLDIFVDKIYVYKGK